MPRRNDLHRILIVGSGPIVIGQACEFDYSGAQACKALKSDGYEVVLINSNPATIMTDPDLADRTYVEPLSVAFAEEVIRRRKSFLGRRWCRRTRGPSTAKAIHFVNHFLRSG